MVKLCEIYTELCQIIVSPLRLEQFCQVFFKFCVRVYHEKEWFGKMGKCFQLSTELWPLNNVKNIFRSIS